ncbi:MAG: flagellar basal body P-ring protein FlgI [Planctomycetaceae bacterium]|jgi:flagellar P-ring protein precursor FlgI|nr:flagellar basal body P-ring protein FlgI [Planctomycetaceae bacterium]
MRVIITIAILFVLTVNTFAVQRIGQVCEIKGQEPTVISGFGIVTGLAGTGDRPSEFGILARSMVKELTHRGYPEVKPDTTVRDRNAANSIREVGTSRNMAFVALQATIPATGGRDGQMLDLTVTAMNSAASLEGGVLEVSILMAPVPEKPELAKPLGMAWGKITIDNDRIKTGGTIKGGCRLTADYIHPYIKDNCFTLVMTKNYASMARAAVVAQSINDNDLASQQGVESSTGNRVSSDDNWVARAYNAQNIVVRIPKHCLGNPVPYIAEILGIELLPSTQFQILPRIVIHEREGIISGGEDVDIAACFVSHANITIDVQQPPPAPPQRTVAVDPAGLRVEPVVPNIKLRALTESLNAMKVPTKDIIAIIKNLHQQGAIQAEVIYQ